MIDKVLIDVMQSMSEGDSINAKRWFNEERGEAMLDSLLAKGKAIQEEYPAIAYTDSSIPDNIRTEWVIIRLAYLKLTELWVEHFKKTAAADAINAAPHLKPTDILQVRECLSSGDKYTDCHPLGNDDTKAKSIRMVTNNPPGLYRIVRVSGIIQTVVFPLPGIPASDLPIITEDPTGK